MTVSMMRIGMALYTSSPASEKLVSACMVMKKETVADQAGAVTRSFNGLWIVAGVAVLFIGLLVLLRIKRRRDAE